MNNRSQVLLISDHAEGMESIARQIERICPTPIFTPVNTLPNLLIALDKKTWDLIAADRDSSFVNTLEIPKLLREHKTNAPFIIVSPDQSLNEISKSIQTDTHFDKCKEIYHHFFEDANDAIFIEKMDGTILMVNEKACDLLGYTRGELTSLNVRDITTPEYSDDIPELVEDLKKKGSLILETQNVRKDKSIVDVEISIRLTELENEDVAVVFVRNITQRKRAEQIQSILFEIAKATSASISLEELLKVIHKQLSALIDTTNFAVALYDEDKGAYSFPYVADQRDDPKEFSQDQMRHGVTDYVRRTGIPTLVNRETYRRLKDEGEISLIGTYAPNWLGVPLKTSLGFIGVVIVQSYANGNCYSQKDLELMSVISRHISMAIERKKAEELQSRLFAAVESAAEIVMITDTDQVIQYVNPAFESVTGYSGNEAIGLTPGFLKSGEHTDAFYTELWETLSEGNVWTGRFRNRKKDGTIFEENATISPIRDSLGKIVSYVAVNRDVTQEVALEEQLRQAQKMEAIGQLAGGIAHDFNNILTGILGHSNLLKIEAEPGDHVYVAAEVIEKAVLRATDLTAKLLGFARRGKYRNIPFDVHKTIQEVNALLGRTVDKNIMIRQRFNALNAVVTGDPSQIQQMILNLALNARDAMPKGGSMTFETTIERVDEQYCRMHLGIAPGRYIRISISDTGCGIPKEIQNRVFEPFFTTKEPGKGTGMGLAMAYGIAQNHGGTINLYSETGMGATFKVYLPWSSETAPAEVSEIVDIPIPGTGKILVVDDEEVVREVIAELLSNLGYEVATAESGKAALDYYRKFRREIDLVIIDMIMPEMSGRDCFRGLKKLNPEVKAILATGYGLNALAQEILAEGMTCFIQKPFQLNILSREVAKALMK